MLDREGKPHILSVVASEYRFKAAVVAGREQEAVEVIFQNMPKTFGPKSSNAGGQDWQTSGTRTSKVLG